MPYRTSGKPDDPEKPDRRPDDDDRMILWVALCVSLIGLVPRIFVRGPWGAEPTVALLIAVTSTALLLRGRGKTR